MEFSDWITQRFIEWRGNRIGRDATVTAFAEWIGVSQPLMTSWMKKSGIVPTSAASVSKLVSRFGNQVYAVLGIEPPDMEVEGGDKELVDWLFENATPDERRSVIAYFQQLRREREQKAAKNKLEESAAHSKPKTGPLPKLG